MKNPRHQYNPRTYNTYAYGENSYPDNISDSLKRFATDDLLHTPQPPHPERYEEDTWSRFKHLLGFEPEDAHEHDGSVVSEVARALQAEPGVDSSAIEVSVNEGVVNLQGSVSDPQAKRFAEACAEQVPGVDAVQSEIHVECQRSTSLDTAPNSKKQE